MPSVIWLHESAALDVQSDDKILQVCSPLEARIGNDFTPSNFQCVTFLLAVGCGVTVRHTWLVKYANFASLTLLDFHTWCNRRSLRTEENHFLFEAAQILRRQVEERHIFLWAFSCHVSFERTWPCLGFSQGLLYNFKNPCTLWASWYSKEALLYAKCLYLTHQNHCVLSTILFNYPSKNLCSNWFDLASNPSNSSIGLIFITLKWFHNL